MCVLTGGVRQLALALLLAVGLFLPVAVHAQDVSATDTDSTENVEQSPDTAEQEEGKSGEPEEPNRLGGEYGHTPRHRFDGSFAFLDSADVDSSFLLLSYTYSLKQTVNLSLTLPLIDPDVGTSGTNYEPGDLGIAISWVPFFEISANPWVPKSVGTGLFVLVPTGQAPRTFDAWVINPFLGFVLPLSDHWFFLPQGAMYWGLDRTAFGTDVEVFSLSAGLTYVSDSGFWATVNAELARDFFFDETAVNWEATVGKMFSPRFGLSADFFNYELLDPFTGVPLGSTGDTQININLHFTF